MKTRGIVLESDVSVRTEPADLVLEDRSRFKNDGAFFANGKPDWVRLPSGLWIMSFNGIDAYVSLGTGASLSVTDQTIITWLKTSDTGNYIYSSKDAVKGGLAFLLDANGKLIMHVGVTGASDPSDTAVNDGVWHLVGLTFNDTTNVNIYYLDGAADGTATNAGIFDHTVDKRLGVRVGGASYLAGGIALLRLYNRVLSPGKILQLFNAERHWFGI